MKTYTAEDVLGETLHGLSESTARQLRTLRRWEVFPEQIAGEHAWGLETDLTDDSSSAEQVTISQCSCCGAERVTRTVGGKIHVYYA